MAQVRADADADAEPIGKSPPQLSEALKGETIEQEEARQALRALIDHMVAWPADRGGVEVRGRFAQMVGFGNEKGARVGAPGCLVGLVAGTGFEPVTFRL